MTGKLPIHVLENNTNQSGRRAISAADKMSGDISLLGDLWFLLLLVVEGSASADTVCVTFIPPPPSLSFSLSLCNASPRISIRLLGESVSRMLPREETQEERESREAERWREKKNRGVLHINLETSGKCRCWTRGHLYTVLSHAESSFTTSLVAGAGHLIGPLAVLINDTGRSPSTVSPEL